MVSISLVILIIRSVEYISPLDLSVRMYLHGSGEIKSPLESTIY